MEATGYDAIAQIPEIQEPEEVHMTRRGRRSVTIEEEEEDKGRDLQIYLKMERVIEEKREKTKKKRKKSRRLNRENMKVKLSAGT